MNFWRYRNIFCVAVTPDFFRVTFLYKVNLVQDFLSAYLCPAEKFT